MNGLQLRIKVSLLDRYILEVHGLLTVEQEQHLNKRKSPFNKMLVSLILHRWDKCSPWVWLSLHLLLLWVLTNRWVKCNPRWCSSPWCNNLNPTWWCNLCRWACNNRSTTNKHICSLKWCSNLCKCNHRWWVNPKWCNLCSNTCNSKFNSNNSLWVNPKWCNQECNNPCNNSSTLRVSIPSSNLDEECIIYS